MALKKAQTNRTGANDAARQSRNQTARSVWSAGYAPPLSATQTFCVTVKRPAVPLTSAMTRRNGLFQLQISGDAGPDYIVVATTNLALAGGLPLATNLSPTPPFIWTDPASANLPRRFYRVRLAPQG